MSRWNRMMRDHRFTGRHMMDGLDGELSPRQQARFARHVDECPQCGPMLRSLIRMRAALRQAGEVPVAASVVPAVLERLHRELGDGRPQPS